MMSNIRLAHIAARLGHSVDSRASLPMPQPGEVYWCEFGPNEKTPIDSVKTRPVLILGHAAKTPAYSLVPLVHVLPRTTQFSNYKDFYRLTLNGIEGGFNATDMTSVPIRKLGSIITKLPSDHFHRICRMMSSHFGISDEGSSDPLLRRGDIYPVIDLQHRFKGSENLVLIASRSIRGLNATAHAMPLTLHPCEDGISVMINGTPMNIDTAQIRRVRPTILDNIAVGSIAADTLARLNQTVTQRLSLR